MVFSILITSNRLSTIDSCIKFIQAALIKSHIINAVYFRGLAVTQANRNLQFAYGELNYQSIWQDLMSNQHIELLLCYSSAVQYGLNQSLLQTNFTFSGSSTLAEKITLAERLICFN